MTFFRKLLSDEHAATAVEYAVLLALLLMAMFSMIIFLGSTTKDVWQSNSSQISSALQS